jgi:hypothetical protein
MGDEFVYSPSAKPEKKVPDRSEFAISSSADYWATAVSENPLNRLRLLDAKLARPGVDVESIKARAGELIRELGAAKVLTDPDCIGLVRQLFGQRGVDRLRERAKDNASALQTNTASIVHNSEQDQPR